MVMIYKITQESSLPHLFYTKYCMSLFIVYNKTIFKASKTSKIHSKITSSNLQ